MKIDVGRLLRVLGVTAKLRGREWTALCPNPSHDDTHPSWRMRDSPLSSKHASHKCHACGFGGGPAELVMTVRGLADIMSAVAWLKEFSAGGVAQEPAVDAFRWELMPIQQRRFQLPIEGVFEPLDRWVTAAREYALSRGITTEQVDRFGMGYAVFGRLVNRIIIPTRDTDRIPLNYTARAWTKARKRYLAADSKEGPDTGSMFGQQLWPTTNREVVVVLEGAINALTVDRALPGLPFGTIDGSEPRPAHLLKLSTFQNVILLTDPDAAGGKAAEILSCGLGRHTKITRVILRGGDAQAVGERVVREKILCTGLFNNSRFSRERFA